MTTLLDLDDPVSRAGRRSSRVGTKEERFNGVPTALAGCEGEMNVKAVRRQTSVDEYLVGIDRPVPNKPKIDDTRGLTIGGRDRSRKGHNLADPDTSRNRLVQNDVVEHVGPDI